MCWVMGNAFTDIVEPVYGSHGKLRILVVIQSHIGNGVLRDSYSICSRT